MKTTRRFAVLALPMMVLGSAVCAQDVASEISAGIQTRLDEWAEAFNTRDAAAVCDLFAADLVAVVRGAPDSGKADVCARLEATLADTTRDLTYAPVVEEILPMSSEEMAIVRIAWTLGVENAGVVTTSQERGMDLFRRDPDGIWRIARFIAFSTDPDPAQ